MFNGHLAVSIERETALDRVDSRCLLRAPWEGQFWLYRCPQTWYAACTAHRLLKTYKKPEYDTMKITNRIVEAYLNCKYKAYLLMNGETETPHDYSVLMDELVEDYRPTATQALLRRYKLESAPSIASVTLNHLKQGHSLILDCSVETEQFQFHFDALKKLDGVSSGWVSHYAPVLFCHSDSVRETQKRFLASSAYILSRLTNEPISSNGIVVYGPTCRHTAIQMAKYQRTVPLAIKKMHSLSTIDPPPLLLSSICRSCQFEKHCRRQALDQDNLTLLQRLGPKDVTRCNRKGIFTVNQLSYTFRPRKRNKRVKSKAEPFNVALQALALRDNSVYVVNQPDLPVSETQVYVDMEGTPSSKFVYLIGLHVVGSGPANSHYLWADTEEDERRILTEFCDILETLPDPHLLHFGGYEAKVFQRLLPHVSSDILKNILADKTTDVLKRIDSTVYFPTYSNSLKDIAQFLGYKWETRDATGLDSIVWRHRWERTGAVSLKEQLIRYNDDDCAALRLVTQFLRALPTEDSPPDGTREQPSVKRVASSCSISDDLRRFCKMKPAVEGFEQLVLCAYFDYQRDKVYLRTNPNMKRIQRRQQKNTDVRYRVNSNVEHQCDECAHCRGRSVETLGSGRHKKLSVDLRFSRTGIKRWVVKHHTHWHRCRRCGRHFLPKTYKDTPQFGNALVSWAMYQYVGNRMAFSQIKLTAKECFGIKLPVSRCHLFKGTLASRYRPTTKEILRRIVNGPLIHADETKIRLKGESGFVWVLSNMEEVAYIYRPTRETEFLKDILSDFNGVLVTDFYTGYDSMDCAQQKCLVHLIRDINSDLLKNPFDGELSAIAREFCSLMQEIVGTVDRFGLRARYLKKHVRGVRDWISRLDERQMVSDVAEKYRKRIAKYREKLFVFLEHDGIPWNNNNAEHAVKPFAKYRRLINGMVTEQGLHDYLVLLSLHQTCTYKGIQFLKFLLSGEKEIDSFIERSNSRAGQRALRVEKIGALPIINRILERLHLEELLDEYLPSEDERVTVPATKALLVLVRRLLVSREPLLDIGEWAGDYVPDRLGLTPEQLEGLNDDVVGCALGCLSRSDKTVFVRGLIPHLVGEFGVSLQQFRDDRTEITCQSKYSHVGKERIHPRPATKRLAFILTLSDDGGVPVYFRFVRGDTTDEQTNQKTWDLLTEFAGRHVLYVGDSKLATRKNMAYLNQHGVRLVTALSWTGVEDNSLSTAFREGSAFWQTLDETFDEVDRTESVDRFSVAKELTTSYEGYRLLWYRSERTAELDAIARSNRIERATQQLDELRRRITLPRTRYRERSKVTKSVKKILASCGVNDWIDVAVKTRTKTHSRQGRRGRPGENTRCVEKVTRRFDLSYQLNDARIAECERCDGVFPLVTNVHELSESEILLAYKRPSVTEERFSQLKTDFHVAPAYMRNASRIQALLGVYFLVVLVESLLTRELRQAMADQRIDSLPVDPEDQPCGSPTTSHLIDLFDSIQRHTPPGDSHGQRGFVTELTDLQRRVLKLLDIPETEFCG